MIFYDLLVCLIVTKHKNSWDRNAEMKDGHNTTYYCQKCLGAQRSSRHKILAANLELNGVSINTHIQ